MFSVIISKKGSIELSVSFMVKLIIAIVVFGFGLTIIGNIMSTAESGELTSQIDQQMEDQIRMLMDTGDRIVIFPEEHRLSINTPATYALGILNVLDLPSPAVLFSVDIQCHSYVSPGGDYSENCDYANQWILGPADERILNNAEATLGIAIRPGSDAEFGTYVYNVKVNYDHDSGAKGVYGIAKFRVRVER